MPTDPAVFPLPPEAAMWIREHVIPPRVRSYGHGPHHCPVWGSWCGRCPEAVCSSCRLGYHRCSGPVYAAYPETCIFGADGRPIVGPHLWDALGARDARVWIAPRPCACAVDRRSDLPGPVDPLPRSHVETDGSSHHPLPSAGAQGALF